MYQFSPNVSGIDDANLVCRVRAAYIAAQKTFSDYGESQWGILDRYKAEIHKTVLSGSDEELTAALRNPASNRLFYGFDVIYEPRHSELYPNDEMQKHQALLVENAIVSLAEAVGATRINNPEAPDHRPPEKRTSEELISQISKIVRADFPSPYPNDFGLKIGSGTANLRAVFAVYQQYRTLQLLRICNGTSVLEIGAGLGRTAYYCYSSGAIDYTIIDIPLTNLAQGYFLGRTLGPDKISLYGEEYRPETLRILPPIGLADIKADVVVNVDSLTEMDRSAADSYVSHALNTAKIFLSINHEVNTFTVNEVLKAQAPDLSLMRYPAPMRAGYIEETAFVRHEVFSRKKAPSFLKRLMSAN